MQISWVFVKWAKLLAPWLFLCAFGKALKNRKKRRSEKCEVIYTYQIDYVFCKVLKRAGFLGLKEKNTASIQKIS